MLRPAYFAAMIDSRRIVANGAWNDARTSEFIESYFTGAAVAITLLWIEARMQPATWLNLDDLSGLRARHDSPPHNPSGRNRHGHRTATSESPQPWPWDHHKRVGAAVTLGSPQASRRSRGPWLIHRDVKPENVFLVHQGNDMDHHKRVGAADGITTSESPQPWPWDHHKRVGAADGITTTELAQPWAMASFSATSSPRASSSFIRATTWITTSESAQP